MSTEQDKSAQKDLEALWTVNQTAQYLSVSPVTVYRWIKRNEVIDSSKVVRFSNRVRIPRSEVIRIAGVVRSKLET